MDGRGVTVRPDFCPPPPERTCGKEALGSTVCCPHMSDFEHEILRPYLSVFVLAQIPLDQSGLIMLRCRENDLQSAFATGISWVFPHPGAINLTFDPIKNGL